MDLQVLGLSLRSTKASGTQKLDASLYLFMILRKVWFDPWPTKKSRFAWIDQVKNSVCLIH